MKNSGIRVYLSEIEICNASSSSSLFQVIHIQVINKHCFYGTVGKGKNSPFLSSSDFFLKDFIPPLVFCFVLFCFVFTSQVIKSTGGRLTRGNLI